MDIPESLLEHHITSGELLDGRYEVVRDLGSGSMGVVYECKDRRLGGRSVAIKVLYPELTRDPAAIARFRNEVAAAHEVAHRNVVQSFDYVVDGKLIAYTMEYVEGYSLAKMIEGRDPLPIAALIEILLQMCAGVQAIHEAKIVHRDLKPENVMVSLEGEVKIMDFGIARLDIGRKLTARGSILGTFEYMSPEYLSDGVVHVLNDIYSLGVIAYELVTGRLPHQGDTLFECLNNKVSVDPVLPRILRPECPRELSDMIVRALQRDPNKRYQTARKLHDDLQALGLHSTSNEKKTLELLEEEKIRSGAQSAPRLQRAPRAQQRTARLPQTPAEPVPETPAGTRPFLRVLAALALAGAAFAWSQGRPAGWPQFTGAAAAASLPLAQAAAACDFETVQQLLKGSVDLELRGADGSTPLGAAASAGCLAVSNLLLEQGADPGAKDAAGRTPLDRASAAGHPDVVKLLRHVQSAR